MCCDSTSLVVLIYLHVYKAAETNYVVFNCVMYIESIYNVYNQCQLYKSDFIITLMSERL